MKINLTNIKKGLRYLKHYGWKEFWIRLQEKKEQEAVPYAEWFEKMKVTEVERKQQQKNAASWQNPPKISIVVPLYKTPERFLRELIESVKASSYENWELCLADGSPVTSADCNKSKETGTTQANNKEARSELYGIIQNYLPDERIVYQLLEKNDGIAGNTNAALEMVSGDYIAFLDHDDTITPDALYEMAAAIVEGAKKGDVIDMLYSDEDKINGETGAYADPHFKPDLNIDLLRANNYITHFLMISKTLLEKVGGIRKEYEGAQDFDFILRCVEQAEHVHHVPKVLYHWRVHEQSTAGGGGSKDYALEAGRKAVADHLKRVGINASVETTPYFGFYKVRYVLEEEPRVSIIIPNKDEVDTLKTCLKAIEKTAYQNYEVIIVENNSASDETFRYYDSIVSDRIKVVYYPEKGFNYSKINNFGAKHATGEYFVLMNNDIEVLGEDWLSEMLAVGVRPEVGVVGAKLYYPDNTIQHAGLVYGIGGSLRGIGSNFFQGMHRDRGGYMQRAKFMIDYSAVTAALMMVRRSVYEEVNGFEEELTVAFNDVDFCMKVRKKNYLVVYQPAVEAYHYESKSRGAEDSPEKVARFTREIEFMRNRWETELKAGDPYYNPNFSRVRADYSLGDPALIKR